MSFEIRGLGISRIFDISLRRRGMVNGMSAQNVRSEHAQNIVLR